LNKRPFCLDYFELCSFKRVGRKQHILLANDILKTLRTAAFTTCIVETHRTYSFV
jgi:hypothetical protein